MTEAPLPSDREGAEQRLVFRSAVASEAVALANLINAAFRSEKTGQTWLYDDQSKRFDIVSPDLITDFITCKNTTMLLGIQPHPAKFLSCCYLRQPASETPPHMTPGAAWLGFLVVDPEYHSRGFGTQMLREAEAHAHRAWGADKLEFDVVNTRVELRAWYRKAGYVETGKIRPFDYGQRGRMFLADGLAMVVMKKNLGSELGTSV